MFIAETAKPADVPHYLLILNWMVFLSVPAALAFFGEMLRRIRTEGPKTQLDQFRGPDVAAIWVVFSLVVILPLTLRFSPAEKVPPPVSQTVPKLAPETPGAGLPAPTPPPAAPKTEEQPFGEAGKIVFIMFANALPMLGLLAVFGMKGGRLVDILGLKHMPVPKAIGIGAGLGWLAFALAMAVNALTVYFFPSNEPKQQLVERFIEATGGSQTAVLMAIAFSAVIIAPLNEEILFRGAFYPMFGRALGRVASALLLALLFALIHDTYTAIPGLTLLALLFTLGFEFSGTLVVPVVMHMTFNAINLALILISGGRPTL